jgi:hypothetical protein
MYGPDLVLIRGKMVWQKHKRVVTDYVEIPRQFLSVHGHVTLVEDVMFVNSIPFLVLASHSINLITIEHAPPPQTASSLGALLLCIVQVYAKAGFTVSTIIMNYEFEKVRDHVPSVNINTTAASEHVGEIEQKLCIVGERSHGIICTLPYKTLPQQLVIHLLHFVVMWLNNFPVANSISTTWSLRENILRHWLDYTHLCCTPFVAYCDVHEENTPTNNMTTRGTPVICLGPTGNFQGTYNFLSLVTGQVI